MAKTAAKPRVFRQTYRRQNAAWDSFWLPVDKAGLARTAYSICVRGLDRFYNDLPTCDGAHIDVCFSLSPVRGAYRGKLTWIGAPFSEGNRYHCRIDVSFRSPNGYSDGVTLKAPASLYKKHKYGIPLKPFPVWAWVEID